MDKVICHFAATRPYNNNKGNNYSELNAMQDNTKFNFSYLFCMLSVSII